MFMIMNDRFNFKRLKNQNGFSMIEILVTILVLSFGLLGMAALVTTGMRSNNVSHYRTIATQQTLDIVDRMRANLAGVRAGNYDNLAPGIPASDGCIAVECDVVEMSTYDHAQWNGANAALLPDGNGTVVGNLVGGFTVALTWTEKDMNGVDPNPDPLCPGTADTRCFVTRFSP